MVREVIEGTGINRTTAQRMTAGLRSGMRTDRRTKALALLRKGDSAEVARIVGLSPSRISAMFKGRDLPDQEGPRPDGDESIPVVGMRMQTNVLSAPILTLVRAGLGNFKDEVARKLDQVPWLATDDPVRDPAQFAEFTANFKQFPLV